MSASTQISAIVPNGVHPPAAAGARAAATRDEAVDVRRVRFVARPPAEGDLPIAGWPRGAATFERVALDDLPNEDRAAAASGDLHVCLLASGPDVPFETKQRVDAWIASGGAAVAELVLRGDSVRWRAGRCVVQAAPSRWAEILEAIVAFSFYEAELRALDAATIAAVDRADEDAPLVGLIDARALTSWDAVRTMATTAARWRVHFARIEPHLGRPPAALPAAAQRTFNELAVQVEAAARLADLDDRIEVLEDLYTTASERLSEYSYFRREMRLELAILAVLVVEVILLLIELALPNS